jgi:SAM-dependent methyltransferase
VADGQFAGPRLNVGSGPLAAPGWINIDGSWQAWFARHRRLARVARLLTGRQVGHWSPEVLCHDLRRRLPFADRSITVVFASHVVEHLSRAEAVGFLREAHRVLRPAGVCRIIVPDLEAAVQQYVADRDAGRDDSSDRLMSALHVHSISGANGRGVLALYRGVTSFDHHKWMYDARGACRLMQEAGFTDVRTHAYLESAIPRHWLREVERPDRVLNGSGICVEGRLPD